MENNHTPEIRFPGFTGDWEERRVMDFSEETIGGGTPKTSVKEYWNGEIPWIQSSDLNEHQVSNVYAKKKITKKGLQNSATKVIPKNSIAIVTRVGVGKIALMEYEYATSQDFLSLSNLKVNEWFGVYSLYKQLQKELNNVQGTSIKGITKNELLGKKINTPTNSEEQTKIGIFLKKLDGTIALHQQELTTLKQTKQGFLQKMFPKEGEFLPEVRFPGFSGEWEQRNLGGILKVNSGRDYKHLQQGNIPVYGTGGYMLSVNDKLSDEDAIGIGRKGTIDNPQLLKAPFWTVDTLFYMTTKEKYDLLFCYSLVKKIQWKKYDESTGVPSLSKSSIDKISVCIPTLGEQKKIGNFFKQLDDIITLHQRELDALKETKKAFLQKMFV